MTDGPGAPDRLVVRGLTDVRSIRTIIWPAFREEDGTTADIDYRQDVDMGHLLTETQAAEAGSRPDVLIVANPAAFADAGLTTSLDGIGSTSVPHAWTDQASRWWPIYVQPIVFIYNDLYRLPPSRWTDLLDAGWSDRLVFEAPTRMLTTGPAFAELRSAFGPDDWSRWLADLADRHPRQVADNERAVLEVATGSMWGGLANWNVARRVRAGSPVRHVFLDPTPCIPGFGVVVDGGGSPALAQRFMRWLVSDGGQRAYQRTGRIPASAATAAGLGTSDVIPPTVAALVGTADWVQDPTKWTELFESVLPAIGPASHGKLGTR